MSEEAEVLRIKVYYPFEIARIYGVTTRTLRRWLKPFKEQIGPRNGRYYSVKQVRTILNLLGIPGFIRLD